MSVPAWKLDFILKTYLLAREGKNQKEICEELKIHPSTFVTWKHKHPALRKAFREGLTARKELTQSYTAQDMGTFQDYVYGQLPDTLRDTWNKIVELDKTDNKKNGIAYLEKLLEGYGKTARQHLFIHSLINTCFNLSAAMRMTNTSYQAYLNWRNNDIDFANLCDELKIHVESFVESSLFKLVGLLDGPSVRFACERLMKSKYGAELKVIGDIDKKPTNVINIANLNLTLEQKKEIRDALRKTIESKEVEPNQLPGKVG